MKRSPIFRHSLRHLAQLQEVSGDAPVLLVGQEIRLWLSRLLRPNLPELHVLAYSEIPSNKQIKVVGSVGQAGLPAA